MDNKNFNFFGGYLVEKGVISQNELMDAIAFQEESNKRIGELAAERGYISKEQAEAIFLEQKRVDQPFGSIALQHKYLTRNQLDDLLFAQTVFSTHLGEALLIKGYITPEEFSEELEEFRSRQLQREQLLDSFFKDLPDREILQAVVSSVNRAYVRFGGRELKLESVCFQVYQLYEVSYVVIVRTKERGAVTARFLMSDSLALKVVDGFLKSGASSCNERCIADLNDFFQIVERYLQVALGEAGLTVLKGESSGGRLEKPMAVENDEGLLVELVTPSGPIVLHATVECTDEPAPCQGE